MSGIEPGTYSVRVNRFRGGKLLSDVVVEGVKVGTQDLLLRFK